MCKMRTHKIVHCSTDRDSQTVELSQTSSNGHGCGTSIQWNVMQLEKNNEAPDVPTWKDLGDVC